MRLPLPQWLRHPAAVRCCGILPQFLLLPLVSFLLSLPSPAFTPVLNLVTPRGVQRGTEAELTFHGDRLQNPQQVLLYHPGIEILSLESKDPKTTLAKIRVAADAPLGEHPLRLRCSDGITYMRSLWVGQFPTITEQEPNNSFDESQPVTLNSTVEGTIKREDVDYFLVALKQGQRLSVEVEAMRLGRFMFDASIAILDPKRFELAVADDTALLRNDAFVSAVAPADGDYRVVVREAAYEGDDRCNYRLHIGTFPRPAAIFPTGARPGDKLDFHFIGDPLGPITQSVSIPGEHSGRLPIFATRDDLLAPSPNWIQVSTHASTNETEPNNASKEANPLPPHPCAAHGVLSNKEDVDWFRFAAKKGEKLELRSLGRSLRSPIDPLLTLRDAKGKQLASNDDQGGLDSQITFDPPADGDYFLNIRDHLRRHGDDFTYRIEIARPQPSLTASLPVAERNNSQKWKMICVPRGNRYATVVNVARKNIGCDVALTADSLPTGISLASPPVPRSTTSFPAVFEATAEAPVAGGLHRFTISATGDKAPQLSGPLGETINHIEINNQGVYHATSTDRIAVAVIDEAPLRIELEAPAVPLVQNGTMQLKFRAIRNDGFNAPITTRFLWKPPGIGAANTVEIPKDKSEATYEINANADAPVADWQICILAESKTDQGPVLVSSALVPLKVAEPYLGMSIDMAATEQGRDTNLLCQLEIDREFSGTATATLQGVPHGVTTAPVTFSKDESEITFPLTVAADATPGKHANLFCQVVLQENNHPVTHKLGQGGTLRIDKPAPAPKEKKAAPPKTEEKKPAGKKPLSRLEQLRQRAQ